MFQTKLKNIAAYIDLMINNKKTHNLLNPFTLRIKDEEIQKKFNRRRKAIFDKLTVPVMIVLTLDLLQNILSYFYHD